MGRMSDALLGGDLFAPPIPRASAGHGRQDPSTSYQAATGIVHKLRRYRCGCWLNSRRQGGRVNRSRTGRTLRLSRIDIPHAPFELVEVGLVATAGASSITRTQSNCLGGRMRLPRPYSPVSVRLQVAGRQLGLNWSIRGKSKAQIFRGTDWIAISGRECSFRS